LFWATELKKLPSKENVKLNAGDIIRIETPGGGGYGEKAKV